MSEADMCKCGHAKADHDYYGCIHGTCRDTCKRRYGSIEGKRLAPRGGVSPSGKGRGE